MKIFNIFKEKIRRHNIYIKQHLTFNLGMGLSGFVTFFSDLDPYNEGYNHNFLEGELAILGITSLLLLVLNSYINIEEKLTIKKFKAIKEIGIEKLNLIIGTILLYNYLIFVGVTQNPNFGINPLYKSYQIGFWLYGLFLAASLYNSYKNSN